MKKKLITLSVIGCFAITSCIFQEELGRKCGHTHEYPGPIEEVPTQPIVE